MAMHGSSECPGSYFHVYIQFSCSMPLQVVVCPLYKRCGVVKERVQLSCRRPPFASCYRPVLFLCILMVLYLAEEGRKMTAHSATRHEIMLLLKPMWDCADSNNNSMCAHVHSRDFAWINT